MNHEVEIEFRPSQVTEMSGMSLRHNVARQLMRWWSARAAAPYTATSHPSRRTCSIALLRTLTRGLLSHCPQRRFEVRFL